MQNYHQGIIDFAQMSLLISLNTFNINNSDFVDLL